MARAKKPSAATVLNELRQLEARLQALEAKQAPRGLLSILQKWMSVVHIATALAKLAPNLFVAVAMAWKWCWPAVRWLLGL